MRRAAKRFINHISSERGMSPTTVASYRDDIKKFIEFLEARGGRGMLPGDVTAEMIQDFMEFLATTGYRKKNGAASAHSGRATQCSGERDLIEVRMSWWRQGKA